MKGVWTSYKLIPFIHFVHDCEYIVFIIFNVEKLERKRENTYIILNV